MVKCIKPVAYVLSFFSQQQNGIAYYLSCISPSLRPVSHVENRKPRVKVLEAFRRQVLVGLQGRRVVLSKAGDDEGSDVTASVFQERSVNELSVVEIGQLF